MPQQKTPGVYIFEKDAFPNSVVEVPTGIPVFVGYTKKAARGTQSLDKHPTRISSLAEYEALFGGAPTLQYTFAMEDNVPTISPVATSQFNLYNGLRLYFNNGGGPCWIVSVGSYGTADTPTTKSPDDFGDEVWAALKKEKEPTMVVIPDAVLMSGKDDYKAIWDKAFPHCIAMQNRVAVLDVFNGDQKRTFDETDDIISGTNGFRTLISYEDMSFGAAYYPWVNTNIYASTDASYLNIAKDNLSALSNYIKGEFANPENDPAKARQLKGVDDYLTQMTGEETDPAKILKTHQALAAISQNYQTVMVAVLKQMNLMPPAAAMAGVYARTDAAIGVFKAPANTPVVSVISPAVAISDEEQEDLNVPLDGVAINAIRTFIGRGVLVWGARTLDGNSQDWRYVNVRRTMIMLEQSIAIAAEAYVFEPNDAGTWTTVRTMIGNFLNNQWKAGALAGATPAEAYSVDVGLGSTMTGNDILDGYMRVTVKVAVTRPAEFIVITFQQKMQTS
ncbi:phage tail sheath C-terminal domain-containing protein [uncultured Roseobacter sp.]|uniref:phage tail sheath family protein n=1 Tax=uncultured Roseobacter sp. TaxID=114847 RepID=UPI00261D9D7F|nr:phage tail sheath C-terminal domain-containing protein [uncultured Roseobacter sp.]